MAVGQKSGHRLLLFYCSFTCIYLPGILILLNYNDNIYNIGSFKFIPILLILMFAEVVKLSFSLLETEPTIINKIEVRSASKTRKSWTKIFKEAVKFCTALFILFAAYYAVIVLFGAPIFDSREETTVLTLTLSSLTFVPACLHLGIDSAISILMGVSSQKGNVLMDAVKTNVKATILGTWLGAVVIPLDWDRPWQVWPIPCVVGALIGYTTAHFITLVQTLSILKTSKKLHR